MFFDPARASSSDWPSLLINNPAFKEALQVYAALSQLAPPTNVTDKCDDSTGPSMVELFRQGRCTLIFGSGIFKVRAVVYVRYTIHCMPGSHDFKRDM